MMKNRRLKAVFLLIALPYIAIGQPFFMGDTQAALYEAVKKGDVDTVKRLVKGGEDVNSLFS